MERRSRALRWLLSPAFRLRRIGGARSLNVLALLRGLRARDGWTTVLGLRRRSGTLWCLLPATFLLRSFAWRRPLNGLAALRRLGTRRAWTTLLRRCSGTLRCLFPAILLLRLRLLSSLRRRCSRLHFLLLIMLSYYGVARLIAVMLALKRLLLLYPRIAVSGILSLVGR